MNNTQKSHYDAAIKSIDALNRTKQRYVDFIAALGSQSEHDWESTNKQRAAANRARIDLAHDLYEYMMKMYE